MIPNGTSKLCIIRTCGRIHQWPVDYPQRANALRSHAMRSSQSRDVNVCRCGTVNNRITFFMWDEKMSYVKCLRFINLKKKSHTTYVYVLISQDLDARYLFSNRECHLIDDVVPIGQFIRTLIEAHSIINLYEAWLLNEILTVALHVSKLER